MIQILIQAIMWVGGGILAMVLLGMCVYVTGYTWTRGQYDAVINMRRKREDGQSAGE